MTETERLTLMAAFTAALVAAGLSLSYVPHVELVTLITFASGIALGARGGALVGAGGMVLYVFANSALKGFPPSPLPILGAQAAAAGLAGVTGAGWRRFWLAGGARRRWSLRLLPAVGFFLTAVNQVILNASYAWFLGSEGTARGVIFATGMAAGGVDMVGNAFLFAVAGPPVVSVLRRLARSRGWWGPAVGAGALLLLVLSAGAAPAQAEPAPAPADSTRGGKAPSLRPLRITQGPLWAEMDLGGIAVRGLASLQAGGDWAGSQRSLSPSPALSPVLDRWGLGWGRFRACYDGLPLSGPVHGGGEPPDLPLAWAGSWRERWTATGTTVALSAPPSPGAHPTSQISLTTGSLGRRTAEFALFRNLGGVNLGVDFADREQQGVFVLRQADGDRVWFRVESVPGKRPDWSLDLSSGSRERKLLSGVEVEHAVRRAQASLRGPFLGGETRLALQLRRQALQIRRTAIPFDELLLDGFTARAEWAGPVPGVTVHLQWDRDRRRGILPEARTFDGLRAGVDVAGGRAWKWELAASAGHQEPYGFTREANGVLARETETWGVRVAAGHEETLPSWIGGLDRAVPEYGLPDRLNRYEQAERPEKRTGVRLEARGRSGGVQLRLGGWATRIRNYRIDANPLWLPAVSPYGMSAYPSPDADVTGLYGAGKVELARGWYLEGTGRVQSRPGDEAPYLAHWNGEGAVHWRRWWFSRSLDLDAAVGGLVVGRRRTPAGTEYPVETLGYLRLVGHVDNGVLTMSFENLLDSYAESDLRADDVITPVPVAGRTFLLGLTLYLSD